MDKEGSMRIDYRDPLIAMSFFAVLFFIILVVILIVWCKKRRQTEVKTVVIQPKKRPISTKAPNRSSEHTNGNHVDVEAAAVVADEIELSEGNDEPANTDTTEPQSSETPEQKLTHQSEERNVEQTAETAASAEVQEEAKGEVNPSFQKEDDEDTPTS